ncbi:MAG: PEBP family protein [Chloroflexi bacterium]|nr:PEBP family protein [Chloroflexota bacterium]
MKYYLTRSLFFLAMLLSACTRQPKNDAATVHSTTIQNAGTVTLRGEAWADNWFAFYLGEQLIVEDSVPITVERSFNAETFTFKADYPLQLNFILKDFKENDTGLEYIKTSRQQMGDGGFIVQFTDTKSGQWVAVSDASWKCTVIQQAPLDKACAKVAEPVAGEGACGFSALAEPIGWKRADFDDSRWDNATVYSAAEVGPKDGYDVIQWQPAAKLIWGDDLQTDNTILCRALVTAP